MSLALDSSVALTWCLPGQASLSSLSILKQVQQDGALVPSIWHIEMANILGLKARDGHLSQRDLDDIFTLFAMLKISTEDERRSKIDWLLGLMSKYGLAAYDSIYLDLAMRNHLPLATFDKAMIDAAKRTGVALVQIF